MKHFNGLQLWHRFLMAHKLVSFVALTLIVFSSFAGSLFVSRTFSARADTTNSVLLDYGASGYRYEVVQHGDGQGFEAPAYDDSAFQVGSAAFGTGGYCPLDSTINTSWPPNTDILVRKAINLPAGTTGVAVHVAIDNDAVVYWNGVQIGSTVHENCAARDTLVATAPDSVVIAGSNVLAVRGTDRGGLTYLDVQVTAQVGSSIPVVQSVSPSAGPMRGGTPITVTGSGFTGASAVTLGSSFTSQPCYPNPTLSCFTVSTDGTQITLTTPPVNSPRTVDIRVFAADGVTGSTVSPADQFIYLTAGCGAISPTSVLDNFMAQLCLMTRGLTAITAQQDASLKSVLASLPSVSRNKPDCNSKKETCNWSGPFAVFLPESTEERMKATVELLRSELPEEVKDMVKDMIAEKIIDRFPCTLQGYNSLNEASGDAVNSEGYFNNFYQALSGADGKSHSEEFARLVDSMDKANLSLIRALLEAADGMRKLSSQCANELQAQVDTMTEEATALFSAKSAAMNVQQAFDYKPKYGWLRFSIPHVGVSFVEKPSLFPLPHWAYPTGVPPTDKIIAFPIPLPGGVRAQ